MAPFKSEAQRRLFFAAATTPASKWKKGEKPKITIAIAKRWAHETPNLKNLPEKVERKAKIIALNRAIKQRRRKQK